ncbi:hypothetical protein C8F01DRAFT_516177 [Mycena amicta]|nr:hypothetical protein C8F01DRAFT_516177 [Mycena amicta]
MHQMPAATATILAALRPMATPQELQQSFDDLVNCQGFQGAVDYLQQLSDALASGPVFGPTVPPVNAEVKFADVGPFRIFYNSMSPGKFAGNGMWNFYIGQRGEGQHSIMEDWVERGIVVEVPNPLGVWTDCKVLTVPASTKVRITYGPSGSRVTEEVVFPRDPQDPSNNIRVHFLRW